MKWRLTQTSPIQPNVSVIIYNEENFEEFTASTVEECFKRKKKGRTTWINVENLEDTSFIEELGRRLKLHPLLIEDMRNTKQRPKIDESENYLFIVMKMMELNTSGEVTEEQVSLVLTEDTVVTFLENMGDVFEVIRDRIRNSKGIIRRMGSDYLAYSIIDSIVDNYFTVLENIGDKIEALEEDLINNPNTQVLQALHKARREMITLRRSVWPLRGMVDMLERCRNPVICEAMNIYFRDLYDHTVQIMDAVETNRDIISSILDVYLTSVSNRMNEVMKFLTIIGTIFIPLTFIAGLYGMNFRFMPELDFIWGYPFALMLMLLTALAMMYYFRTKRWI